MNCPGVNCPGVNCPGVNCQGVNCPGIVYVLSVWINLSCKLCKNFVVGGMTHIFSMGMGQLTHGFSGLGTSLHMHLFIPEQG